MRILFLNQYFPPDPAPTGVLLHELASALEAEGHTVDFVAARQNYRVGQQKKGRVFREIKALGIMLAESLGRPRADVVISATSPPCLLPVATLIAAWHRARSIHWIMDLYPEIAIALGELSPGFLASLIESVMGWGYRRCEHVVALDADMAHRVRRYGIDATIIRPWVFESMLQTEASPVAPQAPWTWIYSGNLGRAHEWETLLSTQALIEREDPEIRLLFQGGGPSWPAAQARARQLGLKRCEWKPYAALNELRNALLRCHCCVVSQLPETQSMLWPSKVSLLLTVPRPLLWIGPRNGAIARDLRALPHAGIFAPGQQHEIAEWLLGLRKRQTPVSSEHILDAFIHRNESFSKWSALIKQNKRGTNRAIEDVFHH